VKGRYLRGHVSRTKTVKVLLDRKGQARALEIPSYSLRVVKGPSQRRPRPFTATRVLIGSSPESDFAIPDPTVSAVHCEILAGADGFQVRDLGAKNGVRLGGRRVTEAWLEAKDHLTLGDTVVRFEQSKDSTEWPLPEAAGYGGLRGGSPVMKELYARLDRAAASDAPVLLSGETGTGKELAADALVSKGARKDRPLVVVDCARLGASLAESELFGHERGAFTGASTPHAGAFERAQGGTLFLDELGELPVEVQPKLLGVLERKAVQRVGGGSPIAVDVRILAATHRHLAYEVNRGRFRADLFFRLAAVEIRLPSLREHPEDLPQLITHFLSEIPGASHLSPEAFRSLCAHDYPGNVRQLRNEVERAVLGLGSEAPPSAAPHVELETPFRVQKEHLLDSFERAYLVRLLEAAKGNISDAARRSGLSRVRLYEMLHRWKLNAR
jgi:two-component system response regulator GlrR